MLAEKIILINYIFIDSFLGLSMSICIFFGFLPLQRFAAQMLFTKDFSSFVHERKPFKLISSSMVFRLTKV
jgi:hypothetical protein